MTSTKTDRPVVKTKLVNIKPGMTVQVHQKIKEKNAKGIEKERVQVFEGIVLSVHRKNEIGATMTIRKISDGIGVEKIFPINSPVITKIVAVKQAKVRQAKPNYLRASKKKLKEKKI